MNIPWVFLAGDVERVVETLPVAIVMTDVDGTIVAANRAALSLFDYDREALLGQRLEILIPERYAQQHPKLYQGYVERPATRPMGQGRDLWAKKRQGKEFPVEVGLTLLHTDPTFYLASIVDMTFRKEAEALLKNRQDYLEAALQETRQLLEEQVASSTRLEERQLLGRELHDTLSQNLYGIGLGLRTATAKLDKGDDPRDALTYCLQLTEAALVEMRALLFRLRPQSLDDVPLADVLQNHAQAVGARASFQVSFEHHKHCAEELDFDRKYALYRITTEALHNCTKHAVGASHVQITLISDAEQVSILVADNGPGLQDQGTAVGHGLQTMQERAEAAQGRLEITSDGTGTQVSATIPRSPRGA